MKSQKIEEKIRLLAEAIRGEPVEVAEQLRRRGFVGVIEDGSACPLARYFGEAFETVIIGVDQYVIEYRDPVTGDQGSVETPEELVDFITKFDAGEYPELVEPSKTGLTEADIPW